MNEAIEIPSAKRRFSFAWCFGVGLFHVITSFILLVYYLHARMLRFVDNGASEGLWHNVLWFWSPFVATMGENSDNAWPLLFALGLSVLIGIAAGFLAPAIGRWVRAQLERRGRALPRIPFGLSRRTRIRTAWAIVALEVVWGAWFFYSSLRAENPHLMLPDWFKFRTWAADLSRAPQFALYEGEHRPTSLRSQVEAMDHPQKKREVFGYPLYEPALAITPQDRDTLIRLATSASSFRSYRGPKLCGGFNPDYFLEWKDGNETYYLLLCFGCHEMVLHHEKRDFLGEIRDGAYHKFWAVFEKYRGQQPRGEKANEAGSEATASQSR